MKRFLVTGGAGFVGSNLVRRLQDSYPDARIVVVDDMRTGHFSNLVDERLGCTFRGHLVAQRLQEVDLRALAQKLEPDAIFHEAAITDTTVEDQALMMNDNVASFATLIDIAVEHGSRLVWASSAATYGTQANGATAARRPFRLEDAGRPANIYGFSKWVMENLHRQAIADHPELGIVGLRYFNVFGPGETYKANMASMIYQLARQMLAGRHPRIFHDGEQARDQVSVDDVVGATIAGASSTARNGIYNVGSGVATTFNDIVRILNDTLGNHFVVEYFDNPHPFYQDYTCADLSETHIGLGWTPEHDPPQAIAAYAAWLRDGAQAGATSQSHRGAGTMV